MEQIPPHLNPEDLKHLTTKNALVVEWSHYNYAFLEYYQTLVITDKKAAKDLVIRAENDATE